MSDHIIEWLNAYLDGELKGRKLHQVEEHLASCEACRSELDSLRGVTMALGSDPAPEFPSLDRFAAQVNLLLPQRRTASPEPERFEIGWWMIPVGLMAVWVFISTAVLLGNMVSWADGFGLLGDTASAWISAPSDTPVFTSTLSQIGALSRNGLPWAERSETYARNLFPQIIWQVAVALLYMIWLALWWARHTRQPQVVLLER